MGVQKYLTCALHRIQKGPGYTYKELLVWYCNNTNTHGPKRIVTEGPKKRFLWFLFTLVFAALVFWQWGILVQTYMSWGVSTSLSVGFKTAPFPAVTICNVNPFKYSKVKPLIEDLDEAARTALAKIHTYFISGKVSELPLMANTSLVSAFLQNIPLVIMDESDVNNPAIINLFENSTDGFVLNNPHPPTSDLKVAIKLCSANKTECLYWNFTSGVDAVNEWYSLHFMDIMSKFSISEKKQMAYSGKEFILTCLFGNQPCSYKNFSQIFHHFYGNCYIFNWGLHDKAISSSNPGGEFGLNVVLDINQKEYIPFLSTTAGARLLVHEQKSFPFLKDLGIFVLPGTETSIGISVDKIEHMEAPYSDCTQNGSDVPVTDLFYKMYATSYSVQSCLRSCFQMNLVKMCGCAYNLYPLPADAPYCNFRDHPEWVYCYHKWKYSAESELLCLQTCKQSCNESQHLLTVSMADWPSESSEDWIFHVLSYERDFSTNVTINRDGVMKMNLYFKEINHRSITESSSTTVVWLLSNLGGQFGLWMGGSVICIVEFGEIIIDCLWITIIKLIMWNRNWKLKKAQSQYLGPPPSISQLAEGHMNTGFEPDNVTSDSGQSLQTMSSCEHPVHPIPGTPPPHYDSLRLKSVRVNNE
ncbi:SCNNB protein, partial [Polypterus senegalus]|nr:amiloride-sensitive sodium channel subunit beta-like [Polypterus senegalus]MBN3294544.1 SCNNB protein [Polypterus senegalus]